MKIKNIIGKIILTILINFVFQGSFCQKNYLPGYIITISGDTLKGFVDYRNWELNPDKIFFKGKLVDDISQYTPIDIKGFGVHDEIYESAIINTDISPNKFNTFQPNAELLIRIDTSFLQIVIQGDKSLFYYKNDVGNEQFYIKRDSSYELLVYKKYLKQVEGKSVIAENTRYLGQLSLYFIDCPQIRSNLEEVKYRKSSIEDLFLFYYKCTQSEIEFQKKSEKASKEFGLLAGLSLTSLEFTGDNFNFLINSQYSQSANFSTGLFFDVILPRNQGKWSFYNELMFSSYEFSERFEDYENENSYTIYHTKIGYSYLKMNNMVRFKYPVGNFFIFLNAGISNGMVVASRNYLRKDIKFYFSDRVIEDNALNFVRNYEQGYLFGMGTSFKKYSFEMRHERGNGMSDLPVLKSATYRYYFLFAYRF